MGRVLEHVDLTPEQQFAKECTDYEDYARELLLQGAGVLQVPFWLRVPRALTRLLYEAFLGIGEGRGLSENAQRTMVEAVDRLIDQFQDQLRETQAKKIESAKVQAMLPQFTITNTERRLLRNFLTFLVFEFHRSSSHGERAAALEQAYSLVEREDDGNAEASG